jgi:DNA-binding transcriptional MerR regulator
MQKTRVLLFVFFLPFVANIYYFPDMESKKIYWSISEVAEILGEPAENLRFWETQFPTFCPARNRGGNRTFQKKDIEIAEKIKFLLRDEGFTIEGAVKKLKKLKHIPLETYKKSMNLTLDKEFSADLANFCEILKKIQC